MATATQPQPAQAAAEQATAVFIFRQFFLQLPGVVPNVVFPTAIDRRSEHEADVYYGMADARIGAFRLTMAPLPRK